MKPARLREIETFASEAQMDGAIELAGMMQDLQADRAKMLAFVKDCTFRHANLCNGAMRGRCTCGIVDLRARRDELLKELMN